MYPSSALIKTHSSFKETHVLYYIKDSMTSRTEFGVVQLAYTPFIDSETSLEEFSSHSHVQSETETTRIA